MIKEKQNDVIPLNRLDVGHICNKSLSVRFMTQLKKDLDAGKDVFPSIFGLDHVKRRLVEILMTGNGVLLKGDFGVGKTHLSNAIFTILRDYYLQNQVFTNVGCPVRENSLYLHNYLTGRDVTAYDNVCPVCRHKYIEEFSGLDNVMAERVYLTEGSGFARIQGNEDVEPERILGMYHLVRYAEIGDPFDPRVLEPGKIAQSSGGILFVDELGLLNKEAQYALIQGLQEKQFTPTNSRMTFPVDFLFVATTNNINEYQIHTAINNRLVGLRVDRVGHDDEIRVVKKELEGKGLNTEFPELFLDFLVDTIRLLSDATVYLGPRSSIRASQIAAASATLEGRNIVSYCDVKEGLYTEVSGQASDETFSDCMEMLAKDFPSIRDFLQSRLPVIENVAAYFDLFDDFDSAVQNVDHEVLAPLIEMLPEGERSRSVAISYLDAYIRTCP
ncbi:MAG: sigma 54-interacting transcriptional regulator [Nitrospirae bacterium YQR-1]